MASIGTLRRNPNGAFKGELRFATFQRPIPVQLFRVRKSKDTAPDFRMIAGNGTEVGANSSEALTSSDRPFIKAAACRRKERSVSVPRLFCKSSST